MADKKPTQKPAFTPLDELPAPKMPDIPDRVLEPFEAKHPGGRPTKYRPEFCDALIEDGKRGFSLTAFAATIGVARDTLTEWQNTHPEFSAAVKEHKAHRARIWEGRLSKIADEGGGNGSATATIFGLKNVAPEEWRDRVEHTGADGGPIEISWQTPAAAPVPGDAARDVTPRPAVVDVAPEPTSAGGELLGVAWAAAAPAAPEPNAANSVRSASGSARTERRTPNDAPNPSPKPSRGDKR